MQYQKPPLSIEDQIDLLLSRGLKIVNRPHTSQILSNISYYRLRAYWLPLEVKNNPIHRFKPDTSFTQVLNNYVFDRKLRLIIFDEIERIEIAFRTQIIHKYSMTHGGEWYLCKENFHDTRIFEGFKSLLKKEYVKSNETFISHYKATYTQPLFPPAWVMLELASFGMLSSLYKNLKTTKEKKEVASHFGLHYRVLESWSESLSYLRNLCAHHGRVWNRKFVKSPMYPTHVQEQWLNIPVGATHRNKLYLQLCVIRYLLSFVNPKTSFPIRLKELLNAYPDVPIHYMGFPSEWHKDSFWR